MPNVTVYFEGLCAFQDATPYLQQHETAHFKVFIPRAHGHEATLVARVEGIELSPEPGEEGHDPKRWKPRLMFRRPGTNDLHYLWDITAPLQIGAGELPALDPSGALDFRRRHQGATFKGNAHGPHVELRGGTIGPFPESKACFKDNHKHKVEFMEVLFWTGDITSITSGGHSIKITDTASFVISNTNPEPNGVRHLSAYYDLFVRKHKDDETPDLTLEFCEARSVGSGNCVPDGIIP